MILTYYCIITMIIIAYLLGSIPSAVWIGKNRTVVVIGIDPENPSLYRRANLGHFNGSPAS